MLFTPYPSCKNMILNNSGLSTLFGKSLWQIYIDAMSFLLPLEGDLITLPRWWQILAGDEPVSTWFNGNAGWSQSHGAGLFIRLFPHSNSLEVNSPDIHNTFRILPLTGFSLHRHTAPEGLRIPKPAHPSQPK